MTITTKDKTIPFVDLKAQLKQISPEVWEGIEEVIRNTDFILGKQVKDFEEEFAAYIGSKYCVGVASGTDALHLSLRALNIGPGDEVIIPTNTFIATALAVSYVNAKPVLVDVDPKTCNIDVSKIEKAITEKTKAIIPVHLYGQSADMEAISEISKKYALSIVEDACQAHGAVCYKKHVAKVGTIGDVSCFSFYPGKNLGAYGDGGIISTNSEELAAAVNSLRNYGQKEKYHHREKGFNSRLDTIQAAVLSVKLKYLDEWNRKRVEIARAYDRLLGGISGITLPYYDSKKPYSHVFHLYVIKIKKDRDKLLAYLKDKDIFCGIHYPIPIHLQEAYKDLGYRRGDFPVAETLAKEILSLPIYPELGMSSVEYVAENIIRFVRETSKQND